MHCDTACRCFEEEKSFLDDSLAVTPKKAAYLKEWHQCFALFVRDDTKNPYSYYRAMLDSFKAELENPPDNLTPYFTLEGASLIDSADKVCCLKNDGIRAVTLTWNGENKLAGGKDSDKALTLLGREVIRGLNKNRIFTDLSHLNEKSFYGAIEEALYPIATHSNCRALCDSKRNLTDEQIRLIAERQGLIGLCFYPDFLNGEPFEAIYQNIYHLLSLGCENSIAIGSDFDGGEMSKSLDGIDKLSALYSFLEKRGLQKELLYKIFYANALKCFDKTITMI